MDVYCEVSSTTEDSLKTSLKSSLIGRALIGVCCCCFLPWEKKKKLKNLDNRFSFLGDHRTSKSRCHGSGFIRFNDRCDGATKFDEELLRNTGPCDNDELYSSNQIMQIFSMSI